MKFTLSALILILSFSAVCAVDSSSVFESKNISLPKFSYGGEKFDAKKWKVERIPVLQNSEVAEERLTLTSPDGLIRITQNIFEYKKFGVTEWKTRIENIGREKSKIVEDYKVLAIEAKNAPQKTKLDGVNIRRLKGSDTSYSDFCPADFFLERRPCAESLLMENVLGYSSSEWMPYVGLDFDDLNGVNLAIGWSGNWKAEFEINGAFFKASMGTRKTKFYLNPGESVIQPSILFMKRRETSVADAQNIWRKFILEHKTPKGKDGKPYITPMVASASGYAPSDTFLKAARLVKEQDIGAELLGVDAGWYGGDHTAKSASGFGDWVAKAGDWRLNAKRHPQGLKKISDAAHDAGMAFSLWCEIERVMPDAPLYSEKPEYIIVRPDNRRATLNLGDKAAWKYAFDTLSYLFAKHGVDVWRIDSNCRTDVGTAWKILDEKNPDRIGVAEAKYVEGFYRLWDELKRKFPHMQFDNCASGGKRLDYESLSRSFTVWRSDTQCHQDDEIAESSQIQNYYLHMWLPSHSGGNGAKIEDTYKYVSSISSGMMVPAGLIAIDKHNDKAKKLFTLAKRMRKYFVRDFYQLLSQPENMQNWCAYQAHDPDLNEGFFIAFRRRQSPSDKQMLNLSGIDKNAVYVMEDKNGKTSEIKGDKLKDIIVTLPPRSYAVFFYSQKK